MLLHAAKQLGLGVAKKVDGLHRVADHEDGSACAIRPCVNQRSDELVLPPTRILKFVDEQVPDIVGNRKRGVGGQLILAAKNALCDLRNFDKIDGASFGEHCLQFARGVTEKTED